MGRKRGPQGKKAAAEQSYAARPQQVWCCIATGPSLTAEDCDKVRHLNTVAVNDAYKLAPWAKALYACDSKWWRSHISATRPLQGQKYTQHQNWKEGEAESLGLTVLQSRFWPGLSLEPGLVHTGRNSGYQAINLAVLLGATKIILLGYDMQAGKQTHFFGSHPPEIGNHNHYRDFEREFHTIQPETIGLEIINCTRDTALTAFPRADLDEVLNADFLRPSSLAK